MAGDNFMIINVKNSEVDIDLIKDFNKIELPPVYNIDKDKRRKVVNEVMKILFSRAVFNKTGDTKISNADLLSLLKQKGIAIKVRRLQYALEYLRKSGHIKVLNVNSFTSGEFKTERFIRVLAAHARLNYIYTDRSKVFIKSKFAKLLNDTDLLQKNVKFRSVVQTTEYPIIPDEFRLNPDICTDAYIESRYYPLEVTEQGMDDWEKVKLGIVPAFLLDEYNSLLERWECGDPYAILVLGGQSGLNKLQFRLNQYGSLNNAISSSQTEVSRQGDDSSVTGT